MALRPKLKNRHTFRFKLETGEVIKVKAKVKPATKAISLPLTAAHARKSVAMDGQGNTSKCAMAVCSKEHGDLFPHPIHLVDWFYKRAYFVTKVHPETKLPVECVMYQHHDNIAPMFDTKAGMRQLVKKLEESGTRVINLYPPKHRKRAVGRPHGRNTGERQKTRSITAKGAALRFSRISIGAA